MPIYEYACSTGHHFEEMQSFSHPHVIKCPKCGKRAKRVISLSAFHLKGGGWYSKDVSSSNKPVEKKEEKTETKAETKSEAKTETKTEKTEKPKPKKTKEKPAS